MNYTWERRKKKNNNTFRMCQPCDGRQAVFSSTRRRRGHRVLVMRKKEEKNNNKKNSFFANCPRRVISERIPCFFSRSLLPSVPTPVEKKLVKKVFFFFKLNGGKDSRVSAVVVIVPRRHRRNVNATEDTNFIGFNDSFVRVSTFHRLTLRRL